jgi:hypothetical protein
LVPAATEGECNNVIWRRSMPTFMNKALAYLGLKDLEDDDYYDDDYEDFEEEAA